jgi:hypothetical protein
MPPTGIDGTGGTLTRTDGTPTGCGTLTGCGTDGTPTDVTPTETETPTDGTSCTGPTWRGTASQTGTPTATAGTPTATAGTPTATAPTPLPPAAPPRVTETAVEMHHCAGT